MACWIVWGKKSGRKETTSAFSCQLGTEWFTKSLTAKPLTTKGRRYTKENSGEIAFVIL